MTELISDEPILPEHRKPRLEAVLLSIDAGSTEGGAPILWGIFSHLIVDPESKSTPEAFLRCYLYVQTLGDLEEPIEIGCVDPSGAVVALLQGDDPSQVIGTPWPGRVAMIYPLAFRPEEEGLYVIDIRYKGESFGQTQVVVEFAEVDADKFEKVM